MNTFGRLIAILLGIVLVFLFPLKYIAVSQEQVLNNYVQQESKYFAEELMVKGYLTKEMYTNYVNKIWSGNQRYEIDLIHTKAVAGIEMADIDNTSKNMIFQTFGNGNIKGIGTIGEIISGDSVTVQNISTHSHSNDCYDGHRHDDTCVRAGDMTKKVVMEWTRYTDYSNQDYAPQMKSSFYLRCDTCKNLIMMWINTSAVTGNHSHGSLSAQLSYAVYDTSGNIANKTYAMSAGYTLMDHVFQNTNYQMQLANGTFYNKINSLPVDRMTENPVYTYYTSYPFHWNFGDYLGMSAPYSYTTGSSPIYVPFIGCVHCGKNQPITLSCGSVEDTTVECNQVVTKIEASKPIQTVDKGSAIVTTAIATMLDGSKKTVNCSSNFNPNILGKQTVTLTYTGLVDTAKRQGMKTTTIDVTVELNRLPTKITVTPSTDTVYNGNEPTYIVRVYYDDNSSAIVTTGYTKTGFSKGAGTKNVTFTYVESGISLKATVVIKVRPNKVICDNNHTYELDPYDTDLGCPTCKITLDYIKISPDRIKVEKGKDLVITLIAYYFDGHSEVISSGWTSNFNPDQVGNQIVTVTYQGKTSTVDVQVLYQLRCLQCGIIYEGNQDGTDPGCPVCVNQVLSISATPNQQTVDMGQNITLTVTATYRDGSQSVVGDWHSDYDPFQVGIQNVTIYYKSVVTKVMVEVQSESHVVCSVCGTSYNPLAHPRGCPVCYQTIDYIEAYLRSEDPYVQLGSELSIYVVIIYKDGHRSVDYGDWTVEGYRPQEVGPQRVTVYYKGYASMLNLEVVNTLQRTVCSNGHVYYLNEDGSDPGCHICSMQNETEAAVIYNDVVYTDQIMMELEQNGIYYFAQGDYISVSITAASETIYESLQNMFWVETYIPKEYQYGGMINSEKF